MCWKMEISLDNTYNDRDEIHFGGVIKQAFAYFWLFETLVTSGQSFPDEARVWEPLQMPKAAQSHCTYVEQVNN